MRRLAIVGLTLLLAAAALFLWQRERSPAPVQGPVQAKARIATLPLRAFALNLDPATMADTESRKVATALYTGLIAVDQDGTVRPRLASKWQRQDDRTWVFTLKTGVSFSNGKAVDAAAVVASLCAAMQPGHLQAWSLASIERDAAGKGKVSCTGLAAPDAQTVVVRETRPTPWLFDALAGIGGWIVDVNAPPGAYGVRAGTGPYVVAAVRADDAVELKARTGGAIAPELAGIHFRHVPDPAAAAQLFNTGALDLLEIDSPQLAGQLLKNGQPIRNDARLDRHKLDRVRVVSFNQVALAAKGISPAEFPAFKAAYAAELNRAQMQTRFGIVEPMTTAFPPAASAGLATAAPARPAGPPATLTLLVENDPFSDLVGSMLPTSLGPVQIRYQAIDKGLLIARLLKRDYDMAVLRLESTHSTPEFWAAFFTPGNGYAVFGTEIAGLANRDLTSPAGLQAAASLIDTQGNWIGLFRETGNDLVAKRLTGLRLTQAGQWSLEALEYTP